MAGEICVDSYVGTGAAVDVVLGWVPDYVRIIQTTDGNLTGEWFDGMNDGTSINTAADVTLNSSNGVSKLLDAVKGRGFTVGTAFSTNGKTYRFHAVRQTNR